MLTRCEICNKFRPLCSGYDGRLICREREQECQVNARDEHECRKWERDEGKLWGLISPLMSPSQRTTTCVVHNVARLSSMEFRVMSMTVPMKSLAGGGTYAEPWHHRRTE